MKKNHTTLSQCYANLRKIRRQQPKLKNGYYSLTRHLVALVLKNSRLNDYSLVTNNVALAKEFNCSKKTIQNQVKRLIELGIIIQKTSTTRNITLQLTPSLFKAIEKKLPQLVTGTNKKIEDLRSAVDKSFRHKNNSGTTTDHEKCPYSYTFCESAKTILYPDASLSEGEEVIIANYAYNNHFKNLPQDKKDDKIAFLQTKMHQAKEWVDSMPYRFIPMPQYYFSIENQGVRFSRFLNYAGRKIMAEKNLRIIQSINFQSKKIRNGASDESKIEMIQRHATVIGESCNPTLKRWFLKKAPTLYETWK